MAEKTTGLYVRMNPEKKEKAEAILKKLGLNSATAINMFYDQTTIRLFCIMEFLLELRFQMHGIIWIK